MGFSNSSLGYLNYPTQVIFKCCKLVPVMLGGILIQRKVFSKVDSAAACCMCIGLIAFILADSKVSPVFSLIGKKLFDFCSVDHFRLSKNYHLFWLFCTYNIVISIIKEYNYTPRLQHWLKKISYVKRIQLWNVCQKLCWFLRSQEKYQWNFQLDLFDSFLVKVRLTNENHATVKCSFVWEWHYVISVGQ